MRISPKLKIGIVILMLTLLFTVFNFTDFTKDIKNFFYSISAPIQNFFWGLGNNFSDFFETISEIKNLKEENELLRLENKKLLTELVSLSETKKENEILREALKVGLKEDFQLKTAKIISKDVIKDSILINKGQKDGIKKDWPVITNQRVLVGRIGEVYDDFAEVILTSNKEISLDIEIVSQSALGEEISSPEKEVPGLAKGKGNLEISLNLISKEEEISKGDLVFTSPLGGIFPENLLVGSITEFRKSDIEPFQTAEAKPSFDLKELDILFIITNFR